MLKIIADISITVMLFVLAADLLYLYYTGSWHDPTVWIETAELVSLYLLALLSLCRLAVWVMKGE